MKSIATFSLDTFFFHSYSALQYIAHCTRAIWSMLDVVFVVERKREERAAVLECTKESNLSLALFFVLSHEIYTNSTPTSHLAPLPPTFHLWYKKMTSALIFFFTTPLLSTLMQWQNNWPLSDEHVPLPQRCSLVGADQVFLMMWKPVDTERERV